ncbi:MAG: heat-inducible transcriptional repressor HrcA [Pseudomonadales bacterium]|nr:heat-inducible transcriptional repressor HrcA [Pseudomonadales bacterium]
MAKPEFSERAEILLKVLVERYIRDGQPVGSKTLSQDSSLTVSPATIRNVMSELEERGYVCSPHTSSGRVPTALGYRAFVDSLVTYSPLEKEQIEQIKGALDVRKGPQELVESASNLLAEVTQMAGLVLVPRRNQEFLRQVEFLPLSNNRVLTVLVLNTQEVENRIIPVDREYSPVELKQASDYINENFSGFDLSDAHTELLKTLEDTKKRLDAGMQAAIDLASKALEPEEKSADYIVKGEANLLNIAAESGVERLQEIFDAFNQKRDILYLLDGCMRTEGMRIFIGEESGYDVLDDCSVITSPYTGENNVLGVLAVIGPTRMPYQQVIPIVDITAKILGSALNQLP